MKTMVVFLMCAGIFASCSNSDLSGIFSDPPPNNTSIAPVGGKWELYKNDDVSGIGIPVNPPLRDTVTIFGNRTYTWKSPSTTNAGSVSGVSHQEFRLYTNNNAELFRFVTIRLLGSDLVADMLISKYYFRRI
jgi:hypothetical protein